MIQELNSLDDFNNAVGNTNTGLVVIDFYGKWCAPCKAIAPKFAFLSEKYKNVGFYSIDSGQSSMEQIVTACEINVLPTFCFFKNGRFMFKMEGADAAKLENLIKLNNV